MTTEIEALRASMRAAQVFGKGQYILKGIHWLEIVKLFYKRTHMEGTTKESVICEFTVKGTNNPEMVVGETRSIVFNFEKKGWLSRFKALGLAIVGVDPEARTPPEAEKAVEDIYVALRDDAERQRLGLPENFAAGTLLRC